MPHHYSQNIEKLIWNESFRKWVLKPTSESDAFWYIWQLSNPDRAEDLKLARTVVAALQVRDRQLPESELQQLISQTVIRAKTETSDQSAKPFFRSFWWRLLIWMVLALLVFGLGWFYTHGRTLF
jgi:transmembrane sensor